MNLDSFSAVPSSVARVYGVAIAIAPLLLLASTIAYITEGTGINEGVLGGTIGVWSTIAFTIALMGISRLLEPSAPRAATTLVLLAVAGFCAGTAFNVEAIHIGLSPDFEEALSAVEGSDLIAILAFLPWGWFAPLSFVFAGVMLWRTRMVARWSAALLVAGGVLFVASRPERIEVLALIADTALVVALVPIGWAVFTGVRASSTAAGVAVEAART